MTENISKPSSKDLHAKPFQVLVTLGESTTAGGWSSTPERCWSNILASLINDFQDEPVKLINSGIGANVISDKVPAYNYSGKPAANQRIQNHVIVHNPDLVVISYGLNDARGGTSLEMFRTELKNLVVTIQHYCNPLIVLLGPYFMNDFTVGHPVWSQANHNVFQTFNLEIAKLSNELGCLYTNVYDSYGEAPWMVHYDGVHANDLGHRLIANAVFQTLAQHCSGLSLRTKRLEQTSERWRDESTLKSDYGY